MLVNENPAQARVEDVLGQLLACLERTAPPMGSWQKENNAPEIVLDLWVDGLRYTLTRLKNTPTTADSNLSPREKEIARLVSGGLPNKAISEALAISPWTVGTHLKRIFAKLQVGSRAEMVARVLQEGLLESHGQKTVNHPSCPSLTTHRLS